MRVEFKRLPHGEGLPLPHYATEGAAAMDICAAEDVVIGAGEIKLIKTGFACAIPEGFELQCRPRSGLAVKHGITITNSPGTIDSDYRGEICVVLQNTRPTSEAFGVTMTSFNLFEVRRGDRIAQLVLAPVTRADPVEVEELDETARGAGGFGSTGRN